MNEFDWSQAREDAATYVDTYPLESDDAADRAIRMAMHTMLKYMRAMGASEADKDQFIGLWSSSTNEAFWQGWNAQRDSMRETMKAV